MNFKKVFSLLCLATTISATPVFADINNETLNLISSEKENIVSKGYEISNTFKILINENQINLSNGTLVFNGRTYLPIRELSTFLNANIDYDSNYKVSILSKNNIVIEIPQNRTKATITKNNVTSILNMDNDNKTQSLVLNGVTYLPLRFIAENLGYNIEYNSENKTIKLNEKIIDANNITSETISKEISTESTSQTSTEIKTQTTTQNISEKRPQETTKSIPTKIEIKTPYVGNMTNNKLHYSSCYHVKKMLPEHIKQFETKEDAISAGYNNLCGSCFK